MSDPGHWFEAEPLWFKTAVFYEIHIRGFFDGNGDGSGDFRGLTEKLDYLQWLGVDCIWLLPFYQSPLRDGGYDISDYFQIHPDYGVVEDVRDFIEQAHQRGIRVIADLVLNHTSSEHPWFQESRSSPDSPKRDWYVWSDTVHRYEDARIIFTDTETSNWTWDEQAGAYYWHRFFSHQPDLNFDNPEVQAAMLEVLRFWLDLGLDGCRLDAVPYLFEREGTICENLPETHAYLKRVRAEIDANYPDRVLLAEANQWPADVVDYYGDGDECQMCFHFPVMPRMFMSLRREEAKPMYEILASTPEIPDNCQWGLFLRNHDELTLEMVTDEERDYMYSEYAKDPRMKINVGIRRRLAPLLDNGRDEVELMHAILFSLPGSPGALLRRRDRDGRQRLPRRPRRRAHADAVDRRPQRRLLARRLRAALRAAAHGPGLRLPGGQRRGAAAHPDQPAALAAALHLAAQGAPRVRLRHVRAARAEQPAHLRPHPPLRGRRDAVRAQPRALGPGGGARPVARSRAASPRRSSGARASRPSASGRTCSRSRRAASTGSSSCRTRTPPRSPRTRRSPTSPRSPRWPMADAAAVVAALPEERLQEWVLEQRWFASKAREVAQLNVLEAVTLREDAPALVLALVEARFQTGTHELYQLPLGLRAADEGWDDRVIAEVDGWTVYDALGDSAQARELLHRIRGSSEVGAEHGILRFRWAESARAGYGGAVDVRPVGVEQSNSSIVFGDELILKVFRRLEPGVNPELELLRFLSLRGFPHIAPLAGWYEYAGPADGRDARHAAGVPQRRARRLGAVPGRSRGLPRALAGPRRRHGRAAHRARARSRATRTSRPRSRARRTSRC